MLENGDLIFVKDSSEIGQAIQTSTGNYSHVAIFLDGLIYHASAELGVTCQNPADFFKANYLYDVYVYPEMDIKSVQESAIRHLGKPYNNSFYPDGVGFYCSQFIAEILPIFETIPMKFSDGDQEISSFWQFYYEKLGLSVPNNMPGTNPSYLATSHFLECKERNLYDSDF